ncbi:MAG: Ppx/GppA family phosphatase [Gammaproteobacteria bacterium]|nr:Ppx/GppA family phosphatase [Gammaproteobacteria bacterium]
MSRAPRAVPEVLAAVDLGSSSFHLVVARYSHGQLIVIDRLRDMVRLGAGVGEDGRIEKETAVRALACLERFGQRLRAMHARSVRVVGTHALRVARRKQAFLERAREALGHPIEIVSGMEEARLIYSGVAHVLPSEPGRRLVVDIGGGSTEMIIGSGHDPELLESLPIGCVGLSQSYFGDGKLSGKRIARARLAARVELEPVQERFARRGWERAVGSSGTVRAVADSVRELRPQGGAVITPDGLALLLEALERAGQVRNLRLAAVSEERRTVFPGGVVILAEVFGALGIRQMRFVEGALRDGLLHDMIGRYGAGDARDRTVASMQRRYQVDTGQAGRVEATLLGFLAQVRAAWELDDPLAELTLQWAARLHEIGLDVAHSGYHRHGAYLLENADLPGFAREEQLLLARLVGAHRRRLVLDGLDDLIPPWDQLARRLIVLLRLAVLLHRGRSGAPLPEIALTPRPRGLELRFPVRWLRDHPLSVEDLQQEIQHLRAAGLRLRVYSGIR